jgi:hypothetical protein
MKMAQDVEVKRRLNEIDVAVYACRRNISRFEADIAAGKFTSSAWLTTFLAEQRLLLASLEREKEELLRGTSATRRPAGADMTKDRQTPRSES